MRSRSLSCAAACLRASKNWRTVLKISQATHAPTPNTARIANCCLSNGSLLLPVTTLWEDNGKPAPAAFANRKANSQSREGIRRDLGERFRANLDGCQRAISRACGVHLPRGGRYGDVP